MTTVVIAESVDEALAAVAAGARVIAGGTDLVVGARQGKAQLPDRLVAIDRIAELRQITGSPEGLVIGAAVTHAALCTDRSILTDHTALADAAALIGSPATRNVGTLGGNVMNGSPAMDTGAPLMVLGAEVALRSSTGRRRVSLHDLWLGPGRTSAGSDELCVALHLPARPERFGSAYVRLEYRRAMEIAVVGAAASVTLEADGTIGAVAVALTAVAATIMMVPGLDQLIGSNVEHAVGSIARRASSAAVPIADLRAGEAYRRHTVGVMAGRAVGVAARRAAGESIGSPVNRTEGIGAPR